MPHFAQSAQDKHLRYTGEEGGDGQSEWWEGRSDGEGEVQGEQLAEGEEEVGVELYGGS